MALTFTDIGECGCAANCFPCSLPSTTLHVAYNNTAGPITGVGVLTFGGIDSWSGNVLRTSAPVGGLLGSFLISCAPGCSSYLFAIGGGSQDFFDHPHGCSGFTGSLFTLTSFTCSPLNIVLTFSTVSLTITL